MGWWGRNSKNSQASNDAPSDSPQTQLLNAFMEAERVRVERAFELESKRAEIELKKTQLELADLERIGEEKRKQQLFNANLKERQRAQAAKAREAKRAKATGPQFQLGQGVQCEECAALIDGRAPTHASDLIRHNLEQHGQRFTNGFQQ